MDIKDIRKFLENANEDLVEMGKRVATAYWNLATTGKREYGEEVEKAEIEMRTYLSDKEKFSLVKNALNEEGLNETEKREIKVLYDEMVPNQLPKERIKATVKKEVEMESIFANFRAKIDGKEVSNNEIDEILKNSNDVSLRKKAWIAGKEIGKEIAPRLIELVKIRNENAKYLGYPNYYDMMMELQELSTEQIHEMFHTFKSQTDDLFVEIKEEIDSVLAKRFGISKKELMPWHYADLWFQEVPQIDSYDYDRLLENKDLVDLTVKTYDSIGLDIRDIIERSDLFERKGKNQHAFTITIDKKAKDVRVLANVRANVRWAETMLHEFGHASYDKYIDKNLPLILQEPAHIFTTEAVAMFFGRRARDGEWYKKIVGVDNKTYEEITPRLKKVLNTQLAITARWVMAFVFFEKELYRSPDGDLNNLWYDTVHELQYLNIPEERRNYPDWAAKIHFGTAPVYYHNYLLGEMMASQMRDYIKNNISEEILNPKTGEFFVEKIFKPGALYRWDDLLTKATGETLNPVHMAKQISEK
ncbi:MAG: M3 family oligoendopeptidase [Caldisericaceae bacterium]|nr:M3 family oligoendopeptidase [Caldisericaceae bacterium]